MGISLPRLGKVLASDEDFCAKIVCKKESPNKVRRRRVLRIIVKNG
jgi:hypothetical protein